MATPHKAPAATSVRRRTRRTFAAAAATSAAAVALLAGAPTATAADANVCAYYAYTANVIYARTAPQAAYLLAIGQYQAAQSVVAEGQRQLRSVQNRQAIEGCDVSHFPGLG